MRIGSRGRPGCPASKDQALRPDPAAWLGGVAWLLAAFRLGDACLNQLADERCRQRLVGMEMEGGLGLVVRLEISGQRTQRRPAEREIRTSLRRRAESGNHYAVEAKRWDSVADALLSLRERSIESPYGDCRAHARFSRSRVARYSSMVFGRAVIRKPFDATASALVTGFLCTGDWSNGHVSWQLAPHKPGATITAMHRQAGARNLIEVHGRADRVRCPRPGCPNGAPAGSLPRADFDLEDSWQPPRLPRCLVALTARWSCGNMCCGSMSSTTATRTTNGRACSMPLHIAMPSSSLAPLFRLGSPT